MAELATGAVTTLLGVIGNEALKLGRVRGDVQFIQEEMESMGSFLANLSGNSHEHDEQVRTWMNQVRMLANDCNSCIDLYLYRGDPTLHLPKKGPGRCLQWAPWLLRKLVAQHRASGQLRELKNRAQDIGNRRMRYGVEVKTESSSSVAAQLTDTLLLSATQDHEEGEDDVQHGGDSLKVPLSMTSMWMDKEDYFRRRLEEWIGSVVQAGAETKEEAAKKITNLNATGSKSSLPSIAFVVTKEKDIGPLWGEVLEMAEHHFKGVQGKVVPREIKDVGALANEDKAAVPPEIKDAGALANEDKAAVPPETKDAGAIRTKKKQRPRTPVLLCMKMRRLYHRRQRTPTLLCMKIRRLCHRRPRQPETKNAGALAYKDKPVPPETKDNTNALAQEDKAAVPAETKEAGNFVVVVDVPAVHYNDLPLRPHKILCYILAELERQQRKSSTPRTRWGAYKYTRKKSREINDKIAEVGVDRTINGIVIPNLGDGKDQLSGLQDILDNLFGENDSITQISDEALGKLLRLLIYHSTSAVASAKDKRIRCEVAELYDNIIKQTAKILKRKIEEGLQEQLERKIKEELQEQLKRKIEEGSSSSELQEKRKIEEELREKLKRKIEEGGSNPELQEPEYEGILKTVFPKTNTNTTAANSPLGTSVDEDVKEMVRCVKEMLHELKELDKPDKNQEADIHQNTEKKKEEIIKKIRKQLKIKMMVQKIQNCLESDQRILVILRVDDKHVPIWQETRNSLKALELKCPIVGAVFVVRKTGKQDFPCPDNMQRMEYSLVGVYLDTVVQNTGQHLDFEDTRRILRNILLECEPYEFCMKIFAHALYTKPKRSSEELSKLHKTLCDGATQKSLPSVMFKFSYMELPKEYRSCLLYLAIFPQGHTMRRSTLIGRWVAEGLITTKDWSWSSSVIEAEKCFDTLVARCFVCPAGIGATGKVKSCTVDKLVHGFITKIAMKQRILETRLSRHLAHHFSIFSDVRLRRSETIKDFLKKSSQFSKLKVLDLEGCDCFPQNQHYLSHICMRILMLKYLSLRGTGVTSLPSEIHNLLELEVLDIRETKIPTHATRNILLPKLKRLLAGHVGSSPSGHAKPKNCLKNLLSGPVDSSSADFSSVQIPEKIEKMVGVEILSNVKPKKERDLRDIASLNELKKLGVVINKESHLQKLVDAIFDLLNQSLRFLSITVDITIYKDPPSDLIPKQKFPDVLERLSINESTSTKKGQLLKILAGNGNQLAKVTLTGTFLSQEDLKILANLQNLHCVKLRHNKYDERKLTFNTGEFKNLKEFLVEGNNMTDKFLAEGNNMTEIKFDNGAASNLEKIVLSSTNIVSISGVNCLQKLEEIELKGINDKEMVHSLFDNANHIAKVTLHDTMLEQGDLKILAGNKKMRYLVLLGKFYNGHQLIFKDDFQKLNLLIVDSSESDITKISFTNSSPNLEKIVWSFKEIVSLPGIGKLPALKELELNGGDSLPNKLEEDIKQLKIRLDYKPRAKPKKQEENKIAIFPSLWKAKDWCYRN